MKERRQKPNTPQKYGHRRHIVPIRRRIWQKVVLRWLVMLAVGFAIVWLTQIAKPMFRNYSRGYKLSLVMSAFLYLFLLLRSRVFPLTFSKEWCGWIRERSVEKYTKVPLGCISGPDDHLIRRALHTRCSWVVEKDNGDVAVIKIDTEEIWEGYFKIGDRVRMYKNSKILVKANPRRDDENLMCPLCGVMVMEPICRKCGVDFTEAEPVAEAEDAQ